MNSTYAMDLGMVVLTFLLSLAALVVVGYIFGRMTSNLAAKKNLEHKYFWTGFFLGAVGMVYVGLLALNTPSRE